MLLMTHFKLLLTYALFSLYFISFPRNAKSEIEVNSNKQRPQKLQTTERPSTNALPEVQNDKLFKLTHVRHRQVRLSDKLRQNFLNLLARRDFVVALELEIDPSEEISTVLSITSGELSTPPLLEIGYDSINLELRISYTTMQLEHNALYKVKLSDLGLSGESHTLVIRYTLDNHLQIVVDCFTLFDDAVMELNSAHFPGTQTTVWIGQRNKHHGFAIGRIKILELKSSENDEIVREICPHLDSKSKVLTPRQYHEQYCPDCFQFLDHKLKLFEQELHTLRNLFAKSQEHLRSIAIHQRKCQHGGKNFEFGEKYFDQSNCTECTCAYGHFNCQTQGCPKLPCRHPEIGAEACCPVCKNTCRYMGKDYQHGDVFWPKRCARCECQNGDMMCSYVDEGACPEAYCRDPVIPSHGCCPICPSEDFCKSRPCHPNAMCSNGKFQKSCTCKPGFFGDGHKFCFDVDECSYGNPCGSGALCLNTPGSFTCECLPGFVRLNSTVCLDLALKNEL